MTESETDGDPDLSESDGVETDAVGNERFTRAILQKNSSEKARQLDGDNEE